MGIGVLYGLYDHKYDTVAMLMHAEHLEERFGVGPHTVSVPRLREAENVNLDVYPHLVKDEDFKKLVAVLRLAVPYAGMILSTREEPAFRDEVIKLGISQVSAGSCTGVGGYMENKQGPQASRERSLNSKSVITGHRRRLFLDYARMDTFPAIVPPATGKGGRVTVSCGWPNPGRFITSASPTLF